MNLKEALFMLSELTKETVELESKLINYRMIPVSINGKEIDTSAEEGEIIRILKRLKDLYDYIFELKSAINKANLESGILDKIDALKRSRKYTYTLESMIGSRTLVDGGNVIKYETPNQQIIKELISEMKEVNRNGSIEIERLNTEVQVDFDLGKLEQK